MFIHKQFTLMAKTPHTWKTTSSHRKIRNQVKELLPKNIVEPSKTKKAKAKNFGKHCKSCQVTKQVGDTKDNNCKRSVNNVERNIYKQSGRIKPSNNFRFMLIAQCELTKYIIAYPIIFKNASSIAEMLVEQVILKYGQFKMLKSDRGTEPYRILFHYFYDTHNNVYHFDAW